MYQELILRIVNELHQSGIPYMIIGGQAILVHGEPRMTNDIDITLGIDIDEYPKMADINSKLGLVPLVSEVENFIEKTRTLPVKDKATGIRVDLIFSFIGYEREAIKRGHQLKVKGVNINYASKEDIIIMKIVAGRSKDLDDAAGIIIKNKKLDEKYIHYWLLEFGQILQRDLVAIFEKIKNDSLPS